MTTLDFSPCDSPIEDILYVALQKYASSEAVIHRQHVCGTPAGLFRLDFLVEVGKRKIGLECDGKEFHQDRTRDYLRDVAIVGCGCADVIYRLTGAHLFYRIDNCLALLAKVEPRLFSERGIACVERLATWDHDTAPILDVCDHRASHRNERSDLIARIAWVDGEDVILSAPQTPQLNAQPIPKTNAEHQ